MTSHVAFATGDLTATVDDTGNGGASIQSAEYYLDTVNGDGTLLDATDGSFDSVSEDVTLAVTVPSGEHILYVRGQDFARQLGRLQLGAGQRGRRRWPDHHVPDAGSAAHQPRQHLGVAVSATGDDTDSGGSNIAAAEYFVDTVGADGSGTAMTVNPAAPIAEPGRHDPRGDRERAGRGPSRRLDPQPGRGWATGATLVTVNLVVDKTGPNTSGVTVAPNPNNGTLPVQREHPCRPGDRRRPCPIRSRAR